MVGGTKAGSELLRLVPVMTILQEGSSQRQLLSAPLQQAGMRTTMLSGERDSQEWIWEQTMNLKGGGQAGEYKHIMLEHGVAEGMAEMMGQ